MLGVYSADEYPVIKFKRRDTNYYIPNNGSDSIASQIEAKWNSDYTEVAILSGSGNVFTKEEQSDIQEN